MISKKTDNTASTPVLQNLIVLENDTIKLKILPGMGGKILNLIRKKSGTEFLKQTPVDLTDSRLTCYGQSFLPPFAVGFDECFPNISPSKYLFKGSVLDLPDHGELWTQPWDYQQHSNDSISLWAVGNQMRYQFVKSIQLTDNKVEITYELESFEEAAFDYIWSAHPLLKIDTGDELLLPQEIKKVFLNWSSDPELGDFGDRLNWPKLFGTNSDIDFNYVRDKSDGLAAKLFSDLLNVGQAGIYRKKTDESLLFSFDVDQIPFLGIWICYGGWPQTKTGKDFTLALEPCSARPDSLKEACKRGEQQRISPSTIKCWQLEINLIPGKYNL